MKFGAIKIVICSRQNLFAGALIFFFDEKMTLTPEQEERIRINRERALEIRRKRLESKKSVASNNNNNHEGVAAAVVVVGGDNKTKAEECSIESSSSMAATNGTKTNTSEKKTENAGEEKNDSSDVVTLEDFEVDAPPTVTKREAMEKYCLPEGTLAVCSFSTRENPRRKGWHPMKLYNRAEIRERARKRHGGLEGLIRERQRREEKRLKRDLDATKDVFRRVKQRRL